MQKYLLPIITFVFFNTIISNDRDPLARINYTQAFNQVEVYKQFSDLMHIWGCETNVFNSEELSDSIVTKDINKVAALRALFPECNGGLFFKKLQRLFGVKKAKQICADAELLNKASRSEKHMSQLDKRAWQVLRKSYAKLIPNEQKKQLDLPDNLTEEINPDILKLIMRPLRELQFFKACLDQLNNHRSQAKLEPLVEKSLGAGVNVMGTIITGLLILKSASTGVDSIGLGTLVSSTSICELFPEFYKTFFRATPPDSLHELEQFFAKNKCFIPKKLWQPIIQQFLIARQDPTNLQQSIDFIEFALGFKVFTPKNMPALNIESIHSKIDLFFDKFFRNYALEQPTQILPLKSGVHDFVHLVMQGHGSLPFYQYLYSKSGGEGKSFFMMTLCKGLTKLLSEKIYVNTKERIRTPEELEGSGRQAGALLRNLRGQLAQDKVASIMVLDEASWLADEAFASDAKHTLNRDLSTISTRYFGDGVDGTGISFDIPPMLILAAGNKEITDPPLKSRFSITEFPAPTKKALKIRASKLFEQHRLYKIALQKKRVDEVTTALNKKIDTDNSINNFRALEQVIPIIATMIIERPEEPIGKKNKRIKKKNNRKK